MAFLFQQRRSPSRRRQFEGMSATQLYCPKCQRAMPVREKLALYLLSGAIYHYVCDGCGTVLGKKEDKLPVGTP